jgi:hypothetical protein
MGDSPYNAIVNTTDILMSFRQNELSMYIKNKAEILDITTVIRNRVVG